jgi:hypothetical protein
VLESFAPLANSAAESILLPISNAMNQFGKAAQVAMGEAALVKRQLDQAKESGASSQSIAALETRLQALNEAAADPAIAQQAKQITAFVNQLSELGNIATNVARTIGGILSPIVTVLGTNLSSVAVFLASVALALGAIRTITTAAVIAMTAMNVVMNATAAQEARIAGLATVFRFLGINITGAEIATIGFTRAMRVLGVSTIIGGIVVALGMMAESLLKMGDNAAASAEKTKAAMSQILDAARSGNTALLSMQSTTAKISIENTKQALKELDKINFGRFGKTLLTEDEANKLKTFGGLKDVSTSIVQNKADLKKQLQDSIKQDLSTLKTIEKVGTFVNTDGRP